MEINRQGAKDTESTKNFQPRIFNHETLFTGASGDRGVHWPHIPLAYVKEPGASYPGWLSLQANYVRFYYDKTQAIQSRPGAAGQSKPAFNHRWTRMNTDCTSGVSAGATNRSENSDGGFLPKAATPKRTCRATIAEPFMAGSSVNQIQKSRRR